MLTLLRSMRNKIAAWTPTDRTLRHAALVAMIAGAFNFGDAATAAELQTIRSIEAATIYVERDTIERNDGKSAAWTVWGHTTEQVNLHDEPYRSARLLNEYDCAARTVLLVEIVEYVKPLGNGNVVRSYPGTDFDPRPVSPGSVADEIMNAVCSPAASATLRSF